MRAGDKVTFPYRDEGMTKTATVHATILSMGGEATVARETRRSVKGTSKMVTVASEHIIYQVDPAILTVTESYPEGKNFDPWRFIATGERG